MKRIFSLVSVLAFVLSLSAVSSAMDSMKKDSGMMMGMKCAKGQTYVKGYKKKDGTLVKGYCKKAKAGKM